MSINPTSNFITLPNRPIVQINGDVIQGPLQLHYWEWQGHQPIILLCHAASLHGRCYDPIINEALNGYHVIALDLRGHGRSQQHPPPYTFPCLGEDVLAFIEAMKLPTDNLIGIGHSMGGYALTYAATIASKRLFRSLLLLDPGIIPRLSYGIGDQKVEALEYILRRKGQWSSVEEIIDRLEKRKPFSYWPKETLRNYCTYGLDDHYRLACSPSGEHSLYQSSLHSSSNIFPLIEKAQFIHDIPIHVVRSSLPFDVGVFQSSPTDPDLAKSFRKGRDTYLNDVKHFFPIEQPSLLVPFIKDIIKEELRSNL